MHPKREQNPRARRPKAPRGEYDDLVEAAWEAEWWCERSGKNYIKCYPPDGGRMVVVKATPSGSKTLANTRAQFRRRGLDV